MVSTLLPTFGIVKTLFINVILSCVAGYLSWSYVGKFIPQFIERKFFGKDQCKVNQVPVAEPLGVVAAAIYLVTVFCFIPVPFYEWQQVEEGHAPYVRLLSLLAGLISICTAILLGFADDMLDLRWRHKLLFPFVSSFPLAIVYYVSGEKTGMLLPKFLHQYVGQTYVEFSFLFYVYIIMLVIFCTNAINIIAGINGVEAGQSIVIAISVAIFNLVQVVRLSDELIWCHCLSFCILGPFIGASLGLFWHNKYPAKAFVGDTYCYFAGMTLAVVAIIGHFSKTLLLFLVPQLVPCPRHRLPKLDKETGLLNMSRAEFEFSKLPKLGKLVITVFRVLRLIDYKEFEKDGVRYSSINNLTILNFLLKLYGPQHERDLNNLLLKWQAASSVIAFICRFYLASLLYENVL